jgi:hypothetical protein
MNVGGSLKRIGEFRGRVPYLNVHLIYEGNSFFCKFYRLGQLKAEGHSKTSMAKAISYCFTNFRHLIPTSVPTGRTERSGQAEDTNQL